MKRILFSMMLFLGTMISWAQEEKSDIVGRLFYEQAVQALENRNFIVTYNTFESNRGRKDFG